MLRRRVWEPNRAKCIDGSGLVEVWSTHCRVFFHQTKSFHLVALKTLVSTRLIVTCCCSSDSLKPASSVLPFQVYEDLGRRRRWKRLYIYFLKWGRFQVRCTSTIRITYPFMAKVFLMQMLIWPYVSFFALKFRSSMGRDFAVAPQAGWQVSSGRRRDAQPPRFVSEHPSDSDDW